MTRNAMRPACSSLATLLLLTGCSDDPAPKNKPALCRGAEAKELDALYEQFESDVQPLLTRPQSEGGCTACHTPANSYSVTIYDDARQTMDALWSGGRLSSSGDAGTLLFVLADDAPQPMPQGGARWSDDDRDVLRAFVCDLEASDLDAPVMCAGDPDVGHAIIPRLTNDQYNRTAADLLGDDTGPSADFPADVVEHGFDNNSTRQTFSPAHFENYMDAGHALAVDTLLTPEAIALHFEAENLSAFSYTGSTHPQPGWGGPVPGGYFFERMNAYVTTGLQSFPYDGTYEIRVRARGKNANYLINGVIEDYDVPVEMRVAIDGQEVAVVTVPGNPGYQWGDFIIFDFDADVLSGTHTVRVWINNTTYGSVYQREVQLEVDWIDVGGPEAQDLPLPDQARIDRFLICDGSGPGCVDAVVSNALTTLWRRPATADEVARYATLVAEAEAQGDSFQDGVELVLEAALTSPHYVFRPEIDEDVAVAESHPLAPHELAGRLSYFLWSSAPDADLLATAADGSIVTDEGLAAQVDRMLGDSRAASLTDNFAAQWLGLRQMQYMSPSLDVFPEFDEPLREAMVGEIRELFQAFLSEDRDLRDILDTDFTFVNQRLADHYGMPYSGSGWQRLDVGDAPRGGLVESAGLLTLNAHPAKTSPTRRGKWLLDQLLCQPPAEPPPNVNTSLEPPGPGMSIKEFLEQHRADPQCAACHDSMDAFGLTLEHFDPLGRWRETDDNDMPVDPTGELLNGQVIDGHQGLVDYLHGHPAFERCVTMKMTTYALGRDPEHIDSCALDAVQQSFASSGHTIRGLVRAIVMSPVFRQRRPELEGEYEEVSP